MGSYGNMILPGTSIAEYFGEYRVKNRFSKKKGGKMKKRMLVLGALLMLLSVQLFSQEISEEIMEEVNEALEEVQEELETLQLDLNIDLGSGDVGDKAYVGVYHENMSFEKARELNYSNMYGILITGIVPNSPAHFYRLREDDVLMKMDGEEILNTKKFGSILKSHFVGDKITLTAFRNGKEIEIPFTLGSRNQKITATGEIITKDKTKDEMKKKMKKKKSVGYGGGSWIPVWFIDDNNFADLNYLVEEAGFAPLREEGMFLQGGGGKGNVGKGWFIGGMGAGYTIDKKTGITLNAGDADEKQVTRRLLLNTGFGGVTLDKRFAITKSIIGSVGFMLGGGTHELEISQTDGNYDWFSFEENLADSDNNYIKLNKNYIMFQPKVMLMFRLNSWLGIRSEVGYMKSYSYHEGWNAVSCGDTFEMANSPETAYDGYTISIGPWFGF
jgi:hypothetical protein